MLIMYAVSTNASICPAVLCKKKVPHMLSISHPYFLKGRSPAGWREPDRAHTAHPTPALTL